MSPVTGSPETRATRVCAYVSLVCSVCVCVFECECCVLCMCVYVWVGVAAGKLGVGIYGLFGRNLETGFVTRQRACLRMADSPEESKVNRRSDRIYTRSIESSVSFLTPIIITDTFAISDICVQ